MSQASTTPRVADVVAFRNRYVRAVNIGRDLGDQHALDGYLITEPVRHALERLVRGLQATSTQRAWRLTGGYGSGKSAFGLYLASLFTQPLTKRSTAGHLLDGDTPDLWVLAKKLPRYLPVVITGTRNDASIAIAEAVAQVVTTRRASSSQKTLLERVAKFVRARARRETPAIGAVTLLRDAAAFLGQGNAPAEGVLLIVDEMGRWLEYAANADNDVDASFFQSLAEVCGGQAKGAPLAMLGILHQRFEDYAGGRRDRRTGLEWAKVAERFEDITFAQSLGHTAQLIARAIELNPSLLKRGGRVEAVRTLYGKADALGVLPWTASETGLRRGTPLYPFHPMGLVAALALFRRFGQNERSAFSFLLSSEPFALQDFLRRRKVGSDDLYRVHDLCDWLLAQGALRSAEDERVKRYQLLLEVLRAAPVYSPLELQCLKTVGVLNLLEPQPGLAITREHVAFAVGDDENDDAVREALTKLIEKCLLYVRPATQELCLWPQSSVDVASEVARARKRAPELRRLEAVLEHLPAARPVVAHRHYLESGTLRTAHVCLVDDVAVLERYLAEPVSADGRIVIVPRYPDQDASDTAQRVAAASAAATAGTLIAIREISEEDLELAEQLLAWKQVERECAELRVDAYARAEVQGTIHRLRATLVQHLADLRAPSQGGREAMWWHAGARVSVNDGRALNRLLSEMFDALYRDSPRVRNELINRASVSTAAAAARQRLLERMFTHAEVEDLGIEMTPPEKAIYLSVLKEPALHTRQVTGWGFSPPPADSSWDAAWSAMGDLLESRGLSTVQSVLEHFARPPFGMRESVTLLLIGAFMCVHRQTLILRERGTYLTRIEDSHLARLIKRPDSFELHLVSARAATNAVLKVYRDVLAAHQAVPAVEPVVADLARQLYDWYLSLPEHTLNTAQLQPTHRAALALLGRAGDPVELLLVGLPLALGLTKEVAPIESTPTQLKRLRQALEALLVAGSSRLDVLRADMLKAMAEEVGIRDPQSVRAHLIALGQQTQEDLIDYALKAFIQRTMDGVRDTDRWLDSLATLLAGRSLETWRDDSLHRFRAEFRRVFTLLTRVVALAKLTGKAPGADHAVVAVHVVDQKGVERFVTVPADANGIVPTEDVDAVRKALAHFPVPAYVLARLLLEYSVELPATLEPAA
jgi:hypothetical protein